MFLTTESGLAGRNYGRVRVVHGTEYVGMGKDSWETATENALGKLYLKALAFGADGVICIQIYPHESLVTAIGTAIKFFDEIPQAVQIQDDHLLL
jgi:uncharacterized protein YbjQ (UPF0145 family)